jgi:hypothetical protein
MALMQSRCADIGDESAKGKIKPYELKQEVFANPLASMRVLAFSDCSAAAGNVSSFCLAGNNAGLVLGCYLTHSG